MIPSACSSSPADLPAVHLPSLRPWTFRTGCFLLLAFCCAILRPSEPAAQQTLFAFEDALQGPELVRSFATLGPAVGDCNNDGWPDLFVVEQFGPNLALRVNTGNGFFADHSAAIQIDAAQREKGAGAAFGDYDNDGDLDLFVPVGNFDVGLSAPNILQENDGGRFRVVTQKAGLADAQSSHLATWLDYDRDGYLDLYVANSGFWPQLAPDSRDRLFRNNGDGTFADATEQAGLLKQLSAGGGSSGGVAVGDFDDDGWPDIYVGISGAPNRLFLSDGQGGFRDATTGDFNDLGEPAGVAVGDIDNDGDLDLFQADGVAPQVEAVYRSQMLLNLGEGAFLDVTEGVGLEGVLNVRASYPTMGDIDNDGDLDLLLTLITGGIPSERSHLLYLNNGDGTFDDATEHSGMVLPADGLALADWNLDGFLDLFCSTDGAFNKTPPTPDAAKYTGFRNAFYVNQGNDNHWLRVELVGTRSNRSGIGTRLLARAGDLEQMREMRSGRGFGQDEMVAHFGLGGRNQVDRLEIRWPSGQIDVLENIPTDRKIRVFEGRSAYWEARPTTWSHSLPDSVLAGAELQFEVKVRPALFAEDARIERISADLSELGESSDIPLQDLGDGTYAVSRALTVDTPPGLREATIAIEQESAAGTHLIHLSAIVAVLPTADRMIFDDGPATGWQLRAGEGIWLESESDAEVRRGASAQTILFGGIDPGSTGSFSYAYTATGDGAGSPWLYPQDEVNPFGYTHLSFWLHPGEGHIDSLFVDLGQTTVIAPGIFGVPVHVSLVGDNPDLRALCTLKGGFELLELVVNGTVDPASLGRRWLGLELAEPRWMEVHVPLDSLRGRERSLPLRFIRFRAAGEGTFHIDDLRLSRGSGGWISAVLEEQEQALPQRLSLEQNVPNPFNSGTSIRFSLPQDADEVELAIFNLLGQKVAILFAGRTRSGEQVVNWDGRDDRGRALASGVFLYRLRSEGGMKTRKLVLLR